MKKTQWLLSLVFVLALLPLVGSCFSPWAGDEGTITIALGSSSRSLDIEEKSNFVYTITLKGPGETIQEQFTGANAVMTVTPGSWDLEIKARLPLKDGDAVYGQELQAMGFKTVNVRAGRNPTQTVKMISASEVSTWEQLKDVTGKLSKSPYDEEIIVIKNDIPTPEELAGDAAGNDPRFSEIEIFEKKTVTLIAEKDVNIFSNIFIASNYDTSADPDPDRLLPRGFFYVQGGFYPNDDSIKDYETTLGGVLILGRDGMSGSITIDGKKDIITGVTASVPMVYIDWGGELQMYNNVTLQNNGTSAVKISKDAIIMSSDLDPAESGYAPSGRFNMYGGIIANNTAAASAGGGVFNEGQFTMRGGTIKENTAESGGGVYSGGSIAYCGGDSYPTLNGAGFSLLGGIITENIATEKGGGLYNDNGTFLLAGEPVISGNKAANGGGIYAERAATISSGRVTGNIATENGGGMYCKMADITGYVPDIGIYSGFTISGNTAVNGGGVYNEAGEFTSYGGIIANNTATSNGGGIWNKGMYLMERGTVSGNKAANGGGVYADSDGQFFISNGTVYGSNGGALSNTVTSPNTASAALYCLVSGTAARYGTITFTDVSGKPQSYPRWIPRSSLTTTNNTISVSNGALQ